MSKEQPEKQYTVRVSAEVYEDFFLQSRKLGKSMSFRIVEFMHRETGHPIPNAPKRGKKPAPKAEQPPKKKGR